MSTKITVEDFPEELKDLAPKVREKAVEIANELLQNDSDLTPRKAIDKAIPQAGRWFFDQAG